MCAICTADADECRFCALSGSAAAVSAAGSASIGASGPMACIEMLMQHQQMHQQRENNTQQKLPTTAHAYCASTAGIMSAARPLCNLVTVADVDCQSQVCKSTNVGTRSVANHGWLTSCQLVYDVFVIILYYYYIIIVLLLYYYFCYYFTCHRDVKQLSAY